MIERGCGAVSYTPFSLNGAEARWYNIGINRRGNHMQVKDAFDLICAEYIDKCRESGCDGCIAEYYCIENGLRHSRGPEKGCKERLKQYLQHL